MAFCPNFGPFNAPFDACCGAIGAKNAHKYTNQIDGRGRYEQKPVTRDSPVYPPPEINSETTRWQKRRKKPFGHAALRFPSSRIVVLPGFEPRQTEPKTVVLPLHHKTIVMPKRGAPRLKRCKVTYNFPFSQKFSQKILPKKIGKIQIRSATAKTPHSSSGKATRRAGPR